MAASLLRPGQFSRFQPLAVTPRTGRLRAPGNYRLYSMATSPEEVLAWMVRVALGSFLTFADSSPEEVSVSTLYDSSPDGMRIDTSPELDFASTFCGATAKSRSAPPELLCAVTDVAVKPSASMSPELDDSDSGPPTSWTSMLPELVFRVAPPGIPDTVMSPLLLSTVRPRSLGTVST